MHRLNSAPPRRIIPPNFQLTEEEDSFTSTKENVKAQELPFDFENNFLSLLTIQPRHTALLLGKPSRVVRSDSPSSNPSPKLKFSTPSSFVDSPSKYFHNQISNQENDYIYHCILGTGSFGKVFLAEKKKDEEETLQKPVFAIKVIERKKLLERGNLRRAHAEIRCMEKTSCPFIVNFITSFENKTHLFIVQEFCNGGELFSILNLFGKFSCEATRFYIGQISEALLYLHSKRFAYRDLKPENILLDSKGHVKLVDFGLVKEGITFPDKGGFSFVGTNEYLSPEMIQRKMHGYAVDWWALGIITYELLVGLPPFHSLDVPEMHRKIIEEPFDGKLVYDESARATITQFLVKNPSKRLGSCQTMEMEHKMIRNTEFLVSIDWENLQTKSAPISPNLTHSKDVRYFSKEFTDLPIEF